MGNRPATIPELEREFKLYLLQFGAEYHRGSALISGGRQVYGDHVSIWYPDRTRISRVELAEMQRKVERYFGPVVQVKNHTKTVFTVGEGRRMREIVFILGPNNA